MIDPKTIHIAGARGMLGSALVRAMGHPGYPNEWGARHTIIAAGLVGGIRANMAKPVDYFKENLAIAAKYMQAAMITTQKRLIFIGSSCMYPRLCPQPMKETDLWTGPLEPTNEGYAIAKLAGEALCRFYRKQYGCDFRTAILCNLYGPGDSGFEDPERGHVIPALIRRFQQAKRDGEQAVTLMGTGQAVREFMHVDDAARGILAYLEADEAPATINIGTSEDLSIKSLAFKIADIVGYDGEVMFSGEGDDGMPRKVLSTNWIRGLGWAPTTYLYEGLERLIQDRAMLDGLPRVVKELAR